MRARTGAYTALGVVAWLFAACIIVQVFLAGMGVFDGPERFETHRDFGYLFGWLTLVMVVRHRLAKHEHPLEIPYGVAIAVGAVWPIGEQFLNQFA